MSNVSSINFDRLHEKLCDSPAFYCQNSASLFKRFMGQVVECMDELPLNGGVLDAYDVENILTDVITLDKAAATARYGLSVNVPIVTVGYIYLNYRGCPAFVDSISGGDALMHEEKRGAIVEVRATGTELCYSYLRF